MHLVIISDYSVCNDEIHRDINTFDAMSDSQNGEEYHIHSTEHSNLNVAVAVEPLFETNQQVK